MKFSQEQLTSANNTDLVAFLMEQGEHLKKSGREWKWERNSSVTIKQNRWYQHKYAEGGFPIGFMQRFYNMNFVDAVITLLEHQEVSVNEVITENEPKEFIVPQRNADMRRSYAYLIKKRYIDASIINEFVKRKLIFEDNYHNIVFAGYDPSGVMQHAHRKGTGRNSFGGNVAGSNPEYSFHFEGTSNHLYVFEAPIDLLSYIQLHNENWATHSYVANCGLSTKALHGYLQTHEDINTLHLCLDHDIAGDEGISKFKEEFKNAGYEIDIHLSRYKDWNEDLKALHSIEPIPAVENPKYSMYANTIQTVNEMYLKMDKSQITFRSLMDSYAEFYYQFKDYDLDNLDEISNHFEKLTCLSFALYEKSKLESIELIEALAIEYKTYADRGQLKSKTQNIKSCIEVLKADYMNLKKGTICSHDMANHFLDLAKECSMAIRCVKEMQCKPVEEQLSLKKTDNSIPMIQMV